MIGTHQGEVLVLHVDDEPGFADMAASYLERERERFTVETARGVEEGLGVLDERDVDCVVSDYDMPGQNGLDLLRTVREEYGDLPFVLFTGKGSEEIASEAISAGVDDYLQKATGTERYTILANRIENLVAQRRATATAAQSEERYHNLVDTAPTSIALFDSEGELVYGNQAAADLLEYDDPATMEGMDMVEFVHPEDRQHALERFQRLQEEGETAEATEMRLLTAEGDVRQVRIASAPGTYRGEPVAQAALQHLPPERAGSEGADGEEASTDHAGADRASTDHAGADRALLDRALDSLEDAFYVLDETESFQVWNQRVNELTGYSDGELADADPTQFIAEEDVAAVADAIERVLETGHAVVEARVQTPDGSRPFEFRGHRLADEAGDVVGLAGVGRDVTERQRRERALRALNDFATDVSGYTDPEAVCERAVAAAEDVLAFDRSVLSLEAEGELPATAISSEMDDEDVVAMSVEEGLVGRSYRERESLLVDDVREHPDAEPQGPYRAAVTVPLGDHGVLQAVDEEVGSFDATDRELAELLAAHVTAALDRIEREAHLQEQNERLDEFASLVSHDLRNPLTMLQTSLDLARETGDDEHLDDCEQAVHQMDALIDDLLTLAREGQVVEAVEHVDVTEMARKCWETIGPADATLTVEERVTVAADPDGLRQAVENLLHNAVEHGSTSSRPEADDAVDHAGSDVGIRVGPLAEGSGFYVADDGPGIAAERTDKVFEPGYTTSEEGTGFGLRIVEEVVEAHGWEVAATTSEAGGARFEVRTEG